MKVFTSRGQGHTGCTKPAQIYWMTGDRNRLGTKIQGFLKKKHIGVMNPFGRLKKLVSPSSESYF